MADITTCAECLLRHLNGEHGEHVVYDPDFQQHDPYSVVINRTGPLVENKLIDSKKVKKSVDGWITSINSCYCHIPYDVKTYTDDETSEGKGIGIRDDEINLYIRAHGNVLLLIFDRSELDKAIRDKFRSNQQACAGFLSNCEVFTPKIYPKYITTINQVRNASYSSDIMGGGGGTSKGRYIVEKGLVRGPCVVYKKNNAENNYKCMVKYDGWKETASYIKVLEVFITKEPWRNY